MSQLKDQLALILPKLAKEANQNKDPDVKKRFYQLKSIVESKKDVKKACSAIGVSCDFFYEWGSRLKKNPRILTLKSRSRKPKRSPNQTSKKIEKKVYAMRKAEPAYGPERISFYLQKLFGMKCPPSSVYNVLIRLKLSGQNLKKKLTKRHLKRYTRPWPGHLQMDIKYVPYQIMDKQYYEFNIVDHHSSWRLIRAYEDKSYRSLRKFLEEIEKECPFSIIQIQTDNGTEFTDKYRINTDGNPSGEHELDLWCAKHGIEHKLIPVGVKELNGKVENTHGFDDREFYAKYKFENYQSLERNIRGYNQNWNENRHTKKLNWRTPNEVIQIAYVRCLAFLKTWTDHPESILKLNDDGVFEMSLKAPPPTRKIKKAKRLTATDRYLQWSDWDDKSHKSIIAVSAMSQIFPACYPKKDSQ
jgi:transposase InsO family protein